MVLNWLHRRLWQPTSSRRPRPGKAARAFSPPRLEALEERVALSTFLVTNTNDSGDGSLRQAILNANADPFVDTIAFSIGGGGVQTIRPGSQLPALTKPVVIDGTTQPGYAGSPLIVLDGGSAGTSANGLTLTGGNSAVEGLVVNKFGGSGIVLSGLGGDSILGDYLGTDVAGTSGAGNNIGLQVDSANNVVGSTSPAARNLISGNQVGIRINGTGNVVLGNYIGTDATGAHALGDGVGVGIAGNSNQIGGTQAGARNVISGCASAGVSIAANGNNVQGNYIGTDATGTSALGNGTGVFLNTSQVNLIGGTAPGAGNLISGNGDGIALSNSTSNAIQGNLIGTNATGTTAVGNLRGVFDRTGSNAIGGVASGAGNVISGNRGNGVELDGLNGVVLGNKIGTDITGATALPNNGDGIAIGNSFNHIGSVAATGGNLISGNGGNGIEILTGVGNVIQGNHIGTDVTGARALGNHLNGASISSSVNTIGGTAAAARNVISGNLGDGILFVGGSGNLAEGNYVGTDATGTAALGNGGDGVGINSGTANTIGGTDAGAGNLISGNHGDGIHSLSGVGTTVQGNYIGTDITGTRALGNNGGFDFRVDTNDVIGGTTAAARNVISGNSGNGINGFGGSHNLIEGNYIGTDVTGTEALGNFFGVEMDATMNLMIGGTAAGAGNLISGNRATAVYLFFGQGNSVQGNTIGTDITGTLARGNAGGVTLQFEGNDLVGGTAAGAGNLISANGGGVGLINSDSGVAVQGNVIGTDITGTHALGNQGDGVSLIGGVGNSTIGGTTGSARNLIAGNQGDGILISDGSSENLLEGNYIGTDVSGTRALGNAGNGVEINDRDAGLGWPPPANNTVGGSVAGGGNLISGNGGDGIFLNGFQVSGPSGTVIQGNLVGTDITGTQALGNRANGLEMYGGPSLTTVGGAAAGAGNVISGNLMAGVAMTRDPSGHAPFGNSFLGNNIGTDITGTHALGNHAGIQIGAQVGANTIGGTTVGAGNVISGNLTDGIDIAANGTTIQGNLVGTDITGTAALGNGGDGVLVTNGPNNLIGGTAAGAGNLISGNTGDGIGLAGTGNLVEGNVIGTDVTGTQALANLRGVFITAGMNTVGGTDAGAGNLVSGNRFSGVQLAGGSGSVLEGNVIGTDATGTRPLGNNIDAGVYVTRASSNNTIGGTAAGAGNLISGNTNVQAGVLLEGSGNLVQGNDIGTDVTGTAALGNGNSGVRIFGGVNNQVGGTGPGAGNVISGNSGYGVQIAANNNSVQGNLIGTDVSGSVAVGNSSAGVIVLGGSGNTVGGTAAGAGNVISANADGVDLNGPGNAVQGNLIGTDVSGTAALGNRRLAGVYLFGGFNTVGGTAPGAGNVISGNRNDGIVAQGNSNVIAGNYIGTDVSGTAALGNGQNGLTVTGSNNTVGGTAAGAGNVISANASSGVLLSPPGTGNLIQGNLIGTDATGAAPLGNGANGVTVFGRTQGNTVGGAVGGAGNTIAFNGGDGVRIDTGTGNAVRLNSIFANAGLGIDLVNGGNLNQPAPTLTSATSGGGVTTVQGTLQAAPNATFTVDLYANPDGDGQGAQYLGSLTVTTDASGHATFTVSFAIEVPPGESITATATDGANDTSRFSAPVTVSGA